eukprot:TRINITY_DN13039_c0_g1_i2.p1 TRINITY_DN13039_c0_g1~~TRINITY_DN13039_c0_g1_i2.p1  ORF type:complete len:428 (-),score=54.40 TRINITY_DN13039_c0_g1_i2:112-1395(-)
MEKEKRLSKRTFPIIPQTKVKRCKSMFKQQSSVVLFFQSSGLRKLLVKGTAKCKKEYILYVSNDKILTEIIDCLVLKEMTPGSAVYCHWSAQILSCTQSPTLMQILVTNDWKYLDQLFQVFWCPPAELPQNRLPQKEFPLIREWDLPNYRFYATESIFNIFTQRPRELTNFFSERAEKIIPALLANFADLEVVKFSIKMIDPANKPPWFNLFYKELFKEFDNNPVLIVGISQMIKELSETENNIFESLLSEIPTRVENLLYLFREREFATDANVVLKIYVEHCRVQRKKILGKTVSETLSRFAPLISKILNGDCALGATYALDLVEEEMTSCKNLVFFQNTLPAIIESMFSRQNRNLFMLQVTKLLSSLLTSASEESKEVALILTKLNFASRVEKAYNQGHLELSRYIFGKILDSIPVNLRDARTLR